MRTRNPKRRPEWLQVRMMEGPFRQFHGDWHLVPLADQGCKVTFDLLSILEGLVDRVAKVALDRIFGSVVEAFVKRADATLTPLVSGALSAPASSPSMPHG
jgi:ribosome-associated toxin RatA of RatAB toxin-antitoxin module